MIITKIAKKMIQNFDVIARPKNRKRLLLVHEKRNFPLLSNVLNKKDKMFFNLRKHNLAVALHSTTTKNIGRN